MARNFGAEHDAALGARLGAAVVLFIARLGRKQDHLLNRLDEHLIRKDDVLMHAHRHPGQRLADVIRLRQRAEKVSPKTVEQIEFAARARVDHVRRGEAHPVWYGKPVEGGERGGVLCVDRFAAGENRRVSAHLGAALHGGVPTNRHQTALIAADITFSKAEIQNHLHRVPAKSVLRDAHAPHEHGGFGVANQFGEFLHGRAVEAASRLQFREFQICNLRFEFVQANGVIANKVFVNPPVRDENLQNAVQEGDVAALRNGEPVIRDVRAE